MIFTNWRASLAVLGIAGSVALTGCSSSKSAASASTSLSGTLGSVQSFKALSSYMFPFSTAVQLEATASSIACVTSANPPVKVLGTIATAGTFNIDLSSVAGLPLTCAILDAQGDVLGTFVFKNSAASGLGGGALQVDTVAFTGPHAVGTVSISGGTITVDAASADIPTTGATVTAASAFDPTGLWAITVPTFDLPPGYSAVCVPSVANNNCQGQGPQANMNIYLHRVAGKAFTPNAACEAAVQAGTFPSDDSVTCSGTTGTQDAFALTIWQDQTSETNCGSSGTPALGLTNNQTEALGNIDFSGNSSILAQPLNFVTSVSLSGVTHTIVNGWEDTSNAISQWSMQDCQNVLLSDGTTNAWKCFDAAGNYSINIGGGCVDASSNPVNVSQNLGFPSGSCTNSTVTIAGLSLQQNSCPFSFTPTGGSPETITCGGTFGTFKPDGSAYNGLVTTGDLNSTTTIANIPDTSTIVVGQQVFQQNGGDLSPNTTVASIVNAHTITISSAATGTQAGAQLNFPFFPVNYITSGGLCSSAGNPPSTDAGKLAQEECYANYYYQQLKNGAGDACLQQVNTNWAASTSAGFIQYSTPPQATNQFVAAKFLYFDDNHAAMTQIQDNYPGVAAPGSSNNNAWVPCHVKQKSSIKVTNMSTHAAPVTGDQILVSFVQETHLVDTGNQVCVDAVAAGNTDVAGTTRIMFVLVKQ